MIELELLGNTVTLTEDMLSTDRIQYAVELPDGTLAYLWTYNGTWDDVVDGSGDYQFLVQFGASDYDPTTEINNRVFGVVGIETDASNIPTSGSAEYGGQVFGNFAYVDSEYHAHLTGDVVVSADFSNQTVSGEITNLTVDAEPLGVNLDLDSTSIVGASFETTVSIDASSCGVPCSTITDSEVNGQFYGTAAEEVGGSFAIEGQDSVGDDFIAVGNFAGSQ